LRLPSWLLKSSWSLVDQVSFAAASFLLNVFLAKSLSAFEYGVFSIAFSIYVLVVVIHTALISEPMLVFGASKYDREFEKYLSNLARLQWILSVIIVAVLLVLSVVTSLLSQNLLASNLVALSIASPAILALIFLRRTVYIRGQQHLAGLVGVIHLLLIFFLLMFSVLLLGTRIQPWHGFLIMGLSSLVCTILLSKWLGLNIFIATFSMSTEVIKEHWNYGRWSLPANLLSWFPWNFPYIALAIFSNGENTAYLRSYMNLILPFLHIITAMNTAIVSVLARHRYTIHYHRFLVRILVLIAIASSIYWLLLGIGHDEIVGFLYSGRFIDRSNLLWILACLPIFEGQIVVLVSGLRALEQSSLVFLVYLLGASVSILTSIWFIKLWDLWGLAWSMFCTFASMYVCLLWITLRGRVRIYV
jgi:O-antigen/teichoic acid export membrane protein